MSEPVTKGSNPDPEKLKQSIKGILDHVVDLTVELMLGGKLPGGNENDNDNEKTDNTDKDE